jgi:putative colanic acid biosynthesis acetyltransferase WcaB
MTKTRDVQMTVADLKDICRQDFAANRRVPKSVAIVLSLRAAQFARSRRGVAGRLLYVVVGSFHRLFTEWLLGVEIPASTRIGPGVRLRHATGVVINPLTVIGNDVMIRHGVTLGNRRTRTDCPVIEDGVELGVGCVVIGDIRIGAGARIGANAVVTRDVPPGGTAYVPTTVRGPSPTA